MDKNAIAVFFLKIQSMFNLILDILMDILVIVN